MKARTYSFGYWLRRRRKALDLTQRVLAQAVSCSEDAIRKIEADERRPSRRLAERIADRLAIPVAERTAFLDAARALGSAGLGIDEDPIEPAASPEHSSATNTASVASAPTNYRSLDQLSGELFVGREKELAELKAVLQDVLAGHGRLAILAGEPGIGKTRTANELASYASTKNALVLWGRCYEGGGVPSGGAPSYWPWVQAIRAYVRDRDAERLQAELATGAASIAEIVGEIRERLPHLKSAVMLEPEVARFRLFDAVTTLLRNIGRRQSVVLILDDLHWSDQASLRLLEFVASELKSVRLLIVGTYRDAEISRRHPLSHTLAELTRLGGMHRTVLRGLSKEEVARFIETLFTSAAPLVGLAQEVYRQTEGNPLFVTEVVRLLAQEGVPLGDEAIQTANRSVRIPDGVREVIGRRLDRLSDRCNQALTIASVIGRQFTLGQLSRLIEDLPGDRLLDVLDEALAARVIEELPRTVDQFQFTHALIGETLAEELSTTRRVRLHAQIGQALESLYGADAGSYAAELAHHFARATTVAGNEKLIRYSILAGERALAIHAHEEALGHFERALAAKEEQPADAEWASILFGLGRAQLATFERHRFLNAVATLHRSFDAYEQAGDAAGAVNVADYSLPDFPGFDVAMAPVIQRALDLVPPESKEVGRLLARRGRVLGMQEGDYGGAMAAFARTLDIARRARDTVLEMRTLVSAAYVDFFHRRYAQCIAKGLDALALAPLADDLQAEVTARYWIACARRDTGDLEGMQAQVAAIAEPSRRLSHRFWLAGAFWLSENLCRLKGDWGTARTMSDQGLAISPRDFRLLTTRVLVDYETGELEQGAARSAQLVEVMRLTPPSPAPEYSFTAMVIPIAASISGDTRLLDVAREAADRVLSSPGATPIACLLSRVGLAVLAILRGDAAAVRALYAELGSPQEIMPPPAGINLERLLGRLARSMGELATAIEHFERALASCRECGYRTESAWVAHDFAEALIERSGAGDRARAESLLCEAMADASGLAMPPLSERIRHLQSKR